MVENRASKWTKEQASSQFLPTKRLTYGNSGVDAPRQGSCRLNGFSTRDSLLRCRYRGGEEAAAGTCPMISMFGFGDGDKAQPLLAKHRIGRRGVEKKERGEAEVHGILERRIAEITFRAQGDYSSVIHKQITFLDNEWVACVRRASIIHGTIWQKDAPFSACIPYVWTASATAKGEGEIVRASGWNYR